MSQPLAGKVAVVTGAARNMGRAIADALAADGADVVVHYRGASAENDARETAKAVEQHGRRAHLVAGDLTNVSAIERLFAETQSAFGRLDILVNNAGMVAKKPIAQTSEAEFDQLFAINAKAPFFAMREAAKVMADGGRIVNIGTTLQAAITGMYGAYAGSKAPLEDFSRALAWEIGSRGITVNVVAPGPLDTPFFHAAETEQSVAYCKSRSVLGRLGTPMDIVPMVRFLVSPDAQWVTGQTFFVNSGYATR